MLGAFASKKGAFNAMPGVQIFEKAQKENMLPLAFGLLSPMLEKHLGIGNGKDGSFLNRGEEEPTQYGQQGQSMFGQQGMPQGMPMGGMPQGGMQQPIGGQMNPWGTPPFNPYGNRGY